MTAADVALIASYVCPWGTLLAIAAVAAWTAQRVTHNGLTIHLPSTAVAAPAAAPALPMPAPLFRTASPPYTRPPPAQVRVAPSLDDPYPLPPDPLDEDTGELAPVS